MSAGGVGWGMALDTTKRELAAGTPASGPPIPPALPQVGREQRAPVPPPLPGPTSAAGQAPPPPPTGSARAPTPAPTPSTSAPRVTVPPPPDAPANPKDDAETASRRPAKRRAAGPPRTQIAANDDLPSIGGLIFALHEKPSQQPMKIAAIASVAWALCSILLGWAMLAPELQRAPTFLEMLTRPTAITLAATIVLPIALFWFIAMLVWRAQELKLMSSAMTEVAIRLAEPDRMAEQQIASVGQAVRRQVNHMNEAVSRALGRAGELEALVHNEVASLERSYTQNESRIRGLLEELAGERNALLNTSERVNGSLKELGNDIPSLIDKLAEQQIKLARFIEQAGQNLVGLEQSLAVNATQLATAVGSRTQELQAVLVDRTAEITSALAGGVAQIDGALSGRAGELQTTLSQQSALIQDTLVTHAEGMQAVFDGFAVGLDGALGQRTEQMQSVLDGASMGLDQAIGERTEGLQAVLEEYTRALDATLEARQQSLDGQLVARTKALDEAFSERLKLFDETIIRSTIAIDSTVADKARALSNALEHHAQEIAQVLGRQAGQLDEQLMHGVNAVRRASENVTRQSVDAIEGLAGQAELLRNLSDNLVSQMTGVTNRFDNQGQTMLRAANNLEQANHRIDKTLQQRQAELARTLEQLSSKAEDIDKVMRSYPASLEGTVSEFESRARLAGEQLARGAQEQSRQAYSEMERLKSAAEGETERAVAELRERFQNVSREVSQEIGSLQSRFSSGYEDIRQQARGSLDDIESEQSRLKAEIARLPDAARASAETMRQSLQEQLRALEQLSALSSREAIRADVTPPSATAARPQVKGQAGTGRAVSSVTQTLANELAARSRAAPAALPSSVPAAIASATQGEQGRDGWKLGDLLARASRDEAAAGEFDIGACARALDQTTASAIWSRFRAGQRGVMVRSIYTVEGRTLFDEVQQRFAADTAFRRNIERFLLDFQRLLREADQRDPGGRTSQGYVVSEQGRAYLFLAHATGQLA